MSIGAEGTSAVLLMAGAVSLYGASPHQVLFPRRRLAPRVLLPVGLACLLGALWSLLAVYGPATAVYVFVAALMLLWTLPPLGCAAWRMRRGTDRGEARR